MTHNLDAISGSILQESAAMVRKELAATIDSITIERVVLGLFFTGVKLSDGSGGLCFTPIKMIPEAVCCPSSAKAMPESGRFKGKPVNKALQDLQSANPLKQAIAISTLNALTETCWNQGTLSNFERIMDADPFDKITLTEGSFTVVVGALIPYIKYLKSHQFDYGILELDPRTLKEDEYPHYIPIENSADAIKKADTLIITGTTLLTNTLEGILANRKKGAMVMVVGPTASIHPDALFSRGITHLGGISVYNADALLDVISEGGSGYHFYGKSADKTVIQKR